jgi:hypothetical protein
VAPDVFGWTFGTPLVTADRVYAGAAGGTPYFIPHAAAFCVLDRATGKLLQRWPLAESAGHQWGIAGSLALRAILSSRRRSMVRSTVFLRSEIFFKFPTDFNIVHSLFSRQASCSAYPSVHGAGRYAILEKHRAPLAGPGSRAKGDQEGRETRAQVLPKGRAGETSG